MGSGIKQAWWHDWRWQLVLVALGAVVIRLIYQAGMVYVGSSFHNGGDSEKYLSVARALLTAGRFDHLLPDGRFAEATARMPTYIYFLTGIFRLVGGESLRAVATAQAFIDGLSVIGIGMAAAAFSRRLAVPAAIAAAVLPNFIILSSYILQETFFLLFFSWGLCALLWALRGQRTALLLCLAGMLFGAALSVRLVLTYFGLFVCPAILFALWSCGYGTWPKRVVLSVIPAAVALAVTSPILIDHYRIYGYASYSSQTADHFLFWTYGCLATPKPCTERAAVAEKIRPVVAERVAKLGDEGKNPFAVAKVQMQVALEGLSKLPSTQIATSMAWGAFKNLMQTSFYGVFSQYKQPLTFFSTFSGDSFAARLKAYVMGNSTNVFMIMFAIAQILLVVARVFQIGGVVAGLRDPLWRGMTAVLVFVVAYFLLISGPVADPRYRIPTEPPLIILLVIGLERSGVLQYIRNRKGQRGAQPAAA